jgi:hypothetical protein
VKRWLLVLSLAGSVSPALFAHDVITTRITWNREIIRLIHDRCASCHHPDGPAFSLMTYSEGRPWAVAIKEEILARRMPPWGAVKGFGDFRNDQALTPEQLELVVSWVDGGVPEGEDKDLPPPPKLSSDAPVTHEHGGIPVSGDTTLKHAFLLDGLVPTMVHDDASFQIIAQLPDGSLEPLVWLSHYKTKFGHAFLLRMPLQLPAGTVIRGVPKDSTVTLLPAAPVPATTALSQEHQSGPYSQRPSAGTAPTPGTPAHAEILK